MFNHVIINRENLSHFEWMIPEVKNDWRESHDWFKHKQRTTGKDYPKSKREKYHYFHLCPDIKSGTRP